MITVISQCYITIDGKDVVRQKVLDDESRIGECCEKCMYRDWHPTDVDDPDCVTLHGCNRWDYSYFRII